MLKLKTEKERGITVTPDANLFLEQLFRDYFLKLSIYVRTSVKNPIRADEIVQDSFHEAVNHIETLLHHENPGGWLMNTVKNKIRESERYRLRYLRHFLSIDTDLSVELMAPYEINENVGDEEYFLLIKRIEQTLTKEEFHILKLFVFDGASHMEVAQELNITIWASQKRLERIRKKLYKLFPERKKKK